MKLTVVTVDAPAEALREAIRAPLRSYNESKIGPHASENLAVLLRDGADETVGGLWGRFAFDWLYIDLLVVPEAWRGHNLGRALMVEAEAEAEALRRGCRGIWLSTMAFQARGFYEKLGFAVFGAVDDHPAGGSLSFLSKRL